MKYVIKSLERYDNNEVCFFCAFHSFTPFYSNLDKARKFDDEKSAEKYAFDNLFTHKKGVFEIVAMSEPQQPLAKSKTDSMIEEIQQNKAIAFETINQAQKNLEAALTMGLASFEFGYRCAEKGMNIDAAREHFIKTMRGDK